jgi:ketosteroid isomerase-like protein
LGDPFIVSQTGLSDGEHTRRRTRTRWQTADWGSPGHVWQRDAMSTEETRQLIADYYSALVAGDKDRIMDLLAPDCSWQPPASVRAEASALTALTGAEAIADALGRTVVRTMFDLSKPFSLDVHRTVVDGDVAVVQSRIRATAKTTGNAYDNEYCWVYVCEGGRIARIEEYTDTNVAALAFGWEVAG